MSDALSKRLKTKKGVMQSIGLAAIVVVTTTLGIFFYELRKNKNAVKPLGYRCIDKSKIPQIKDRSGDIVKDRYHPSKTKVPQNIDYIVIGSGMSGLATAACLSRVGRKVLVLEQHDRIGGCLHQYSKAFQFDTGIHYIGKPEKYEKMLAPLTLKNKQIQFVAMGTKENGYIFDEYLIGKDKNMKIFQARANKRKEDLMRMFPSKQDKEAIEKFYALGKEADKLFLFLFIGKLLNIPFIGRLLFKIAKWKYAHLWNKTAYDLMQGVFSHNPLLGMTIMANIGDMGGTLKSNAMLIIFGLYRHYKRGGYFINGGPAQIVRSMMPVIEASGGRCLANAEVQNIIFENNRAVGVKVKAKKGNKIVEFRARCGVISSAGFRNTYSKFVTTDSLPHNVPTHTKMSIERALNVMEPSAQHFHIFLGFDATAKELGFVSHNRWYLLMDNESNNEYDYDSFIQNYHKNPLTAPVMGFLSFPSAKNPDFERERPGKATAILLTEIPYYHFEKWKEGTHSHRGEDYEELKNKIANRLIEELLFKFYPKAKGKIVKKELGTALSAKYYLGSPNGESYGLNHACPRYFDYEINQLLKPKTPINGLWFTGQDIISAGFASALQSGIWTAESILGYHRFTVLASGRNLIKDLNKMDGYKQDKKSVEDYDYDLIKAKYVDTLTDG